MKVLVTGSAGYLGSVLVQLLLSGGHHVRGFDNLTRGEQSPDVLGHPDFEFLAGDIQDEALVQEVLMDVDAVVHLAAIVGDPACARQPDLARAVNLTATRSLVDKATKVGVRRFTFASTCSNYGRMQDPDGVVDEESPLAPISIYAETKVTIERELLAAEELGMCPTLLRFATLFGMSPKMRFDLTVNEFTRSMVRDEGLEVFGEQFWRPYVHVEDAARAIQLVLEAPVEKVHKQVFNVGSNRQNYQKKQIVELIRAVAPNAQVKYIFKAEDPRNYRVAFNKIDKALRFEITKTVADGIAEIAEFVANEQVPAR